MAKKSGHKQVLSFVYKSGIHAVEGMYCVSLIPSLSQRQQVKEIFFFQKEAVVFI